MEPLFTNSFTSSQTQELLTEDQMFLMLLEERNLSCDGDVT